MNRREFLTIASIPFAAREADAARFIQAEVKPQRGAPALFLDGKPAFLGAFWVSAPRPDKWESAEAARRAAEAGVHTYAFDVGSGTEWCGPAPGRAGPYDFSTLEARFGRIVQVDPEARFHLRCQLEIGMDDWWSRRYPDELEAHSDGRRYSQSFASRVAGAGQRLPAGIHPAPLRDRAAGTRHCLSGGRRAYRRVGQGRDLHV